MTSEQWIVAIGLTVMLSCFWYISQKLDKANARIALLEQHLQSMDRRGIYRIVCVPTGATYFGSTRTNFMARWGQHVRDLDNRKHVNLRLQEDWIRYGRDAFAFLAIEILDDDQAIIRRENEILDWRAMYVAPLLNYNQARTKTYSAPAAPDVETVIVERKPSRNRSSPNDPNAFSLEDLGLTPEEIASLNQV